MFANGSGPDEDEELPSLQDAGRRRTPHTQIPKVEPESVGLAGVLSAFSGS